MTPATELKQESEPSTAQGGGIAEVWSMVLCSEKPNHPPGEPAGFCQPQANTGAGQTDFPIIPLICVHVL
jgi:hypothetical protein